MRLPDFLVIGAAKSGTTSLHRYLNQHPGLYLPDYGEPSFFAHEGEELAFVGPGDDEWRFITDLDAYGSLFGPAPPRAVTGEISPRYLYFEAAARRIRQHIPTARIVAVLRHPVDRSYSHYLMNRARGCEPEADFRAALLLEQDRKAQGWGWDWRYVEASRYHGQVLRYAEEFPAQQLFIRLYDDWRDDEGAFFSQLFDFLGVDASFVPDTTARERVASLPRHDWIRRVTAPGGAVTRSLRTLVPGRMATTLKGKVATWNSSPPPTLSPGARQALFEEFFARDRDRLEALLDRSLARWG